MFGTIIIIILYLVPFQDFNTVVYYRNKYKQTALLTPRPSLSTPGPGLFTDIRRRQISGSQGLSSGDQFVDTPAVKSCKYKE